MRALECRDSASKVQLNGSRRKGTVQSCTDNILDLLDVYSDVQFVYYEVEITFRNVLLVFGISLFICNRGERTASEAIYRSIDWNT